MICPYCNSHINDGLEVCPACRKKLYVEHGEPVNSPTFCKQCGSLLGPDDITCPGCGMYCDGREPAPALSNMAIPELDPGATNALPRIESAIPDEDELEESTSTSIKPFAVAGILAVVFVTLFALIIVHPWNPAAYYGRPTEPLDFSTAGPGQIETLSGQDKKAQSEAILTNNDPFEILTTEYNAIMEFAQKVDGIQMKFREYGFSDNETEIANAAKETNLLAIDISNEIAKINNLSFTGSPYEDQRLDLVKLANLLRNRIDGYTAAWNVTKESTNKELDRQRIEAQIEKARANQGAFDEMAIRVKPHEVK